jgi:predicted HAD superfamily Cof-like phosphohydrolase
MDDLKEFHDTFAPEQPREYLHNKIVRRQALIREEYVEVLEALEHYDNTFFDETSSTMAESLEEVAKELADLLYVVYGTAEELGIPLEHVFHEVHKSNMSKSNPDGTVSRNDFGKVLKPPTYVKPDLSFIHDNSLL